VSRRAILFGWQYSRPRLIKLSNTTQRPDIAPMRHYPAYDWKSALALGTIVPSHGGQIFSEQARKILISPRPLPDHHERTAKQKYPRQRETGQA
ncbi:uncharacterized protein METZ01_LOCUS175888, partial [marine metagenome]